MSSLKDQLDNIKILDKNNIPQATIDYLSQRLVETIISQVQISSTYFETIGASPVFMSNSSHSSSYSSIPYSRIAHLNDIMLELQVINTPIFLKCYSHINNALANKRIVDEEARLALQAIKQHMAKIKNTSTDKIVAMSHRYAPDSLPHSNTVSALESYIILQKTHEDVAKNRLEIERNKAIQNAYKVLYTENSRLLFFVPLILFISVVIGIIIGIHFH